MTREQAVAEAAGILADKIPDAGETQVITDAAGVPGRHVGAATSLARWSAILGYASEAAATMQSLLDAIAKDHRATASRVLAALKSAKDTDAAARLSLPRVRSLKLATDTDSVIYVHGKKPHTVRLRVGQAEDEAPPRVDVEESSGEVQQARPVAVDGGEWSVQEFDVAARGWSTRRLTARIADGLRESADARIINWNFAVAVKIAFVLVATACVAIYYIVLKDRPADWSIALGLVPLIGVVLAVAGIALRTALAAWLRIPERMLAATGLLLVALLIPGRLFVRVENRTGSTQTFVGNTVADRKATSLTHGELDEIERTFCAHRDDRGVLDLLYRQEGVTRAAETWTPVGGGDLARLVKAQDSTAAQNVEGVLRFSPCESKCTWADVPFGELTLHIPCRWNAKHESERFALSPNDAGTQQRGDVLTSPKGVTACRFDVGIDITPVEVPPAGGYTLESGGVTTTASNGWYCHPPDGKTVTFKFGVLVLDATITYGWTFIAGKHDGDLPAGRYQLPANRGLFLIAKNGDMVGYVSKDVLKEALVIESNHDQYATEIHLDGIKTQKIVKPQHYCFLDGDQQELCPGAKPKDSGCTPSPKATVGVCKQFPLYQCTAAPC